MGRVTRRVPSLRLRLDGTAVSDAVERADTVAVEEPLEIRVDGSAVTTTMRTPGDDFDLALGHLVTEGLITDPGSVAQMMHCTDQDETGAATFNVVDVTLAPGAELAAPPRPRGSAATSACGVCGTATIEAIMTALPSAGQADGARFAPHMLAGLPDALATRQRTFHRTGGVHAAALFSGSGGLLAAREDVGRHNAVDKVVGWAAREGLLPLRGHVLCVSARASFEIIQKAAVAGIPAVVAVSAPSSMAVDLAARAGMTLVAFTRPPRLNVYAGRERLTPAGVPVATGTQR